MKHYLKPVLKALGFITLYLVVNTVILVGFFALSDVQEIEDISANAMTAMLIGTQLVVLVIILFIYKKNLSSVVRFRKTTPKILLWSFVIGLAGINISAILIGVMGVLFPTQMAEYIEAIEGSIGGANVLLSVIAAVILAPLVEEIALRGMLFRWFEKINTKPWVIVILSGLFFGLFHLNLIQGVFTAVIGVLYALAFYMTKSLWVPIVMHLANNGFAVVASYLPESIFESMVFIVLSYAMLILIPIGFFAIKKEMAQQILVDDAAMSHS